MIVNGFCKKIGKSHKTITCIQDRHWTTKVDIKHRQLERRLTIKKSQGFLDEISCFFVISNNPYTGCHLGPQICSKFGGHREAKSHPSIGFVENDLNPIKVANYGNIK